MYLTIKVTQLMSYDSDTQASEIRESLWSDSILRINGLTLFFDMNNRSLFKNEQFKLYWYYSGLEYKLEKLSQQRLVETWFETGISNAFNASLQSFTVFEQ